MRNRVVLLAAVACLFVIYGTRTQTQSGSPLANREHPRIWITQATIPAMRTKIATNYQSEYQALINRLNSRLADSMDTGDRYDMSAYAFVYAVGSVSGANYGGHTIAEYGERARALMNWFVTIQRNVLDLALTYDWINPLLSSSERSGVVALMAGGIARAEYDDYSTNNWAVGTMVYRAEGAIAGISFANDGLNDAAAATLLDVYNNKIQGTNGYLASNSFTGSDGAWMMGMAYPITERGSGEPPAMLSIPMVLEAWRTANGLTRDSLFNNSNVAYYRNWAQWYLYHVSPFGVPDSASPGGRRFMLQTTQMMEAGTRAAWWYAGTTPVIVNALAGIYKTIDPRMAGLAQWLLNNRVGTMRIPGDDYKFGVFSLFVAGEKGVTPLSPTDLSMPLTKQFTDYGWVAMRTNWTDPGASQVTFSANKWMTYPGSYDRYDSGSFTIERNGPLVIHAGPGGHNPFSEQTWANNTMLFVDPNETAGRAGALWDMGGQRRIYNPIWNKTELVADPTHQINGIKKLLPMGSSPQQDFDYIFSDSTRAYNGDSPSFTDGYSVAKVKNFTRQFVYFRPSSSGDSDVVVVFDRTQSTATRFEKRWLLHTSGSPVIDGSESSVRAGKWKYDGANVVTQTNTNNGSNGKLYSTTLLPATHTIYKIGGAGHEFENPYGLNQPENGPGASPERDQFVGQYRIEVVPTVPALNDNFLHVLEAGDSGLSRSPTVLLSGTGVVGARVGDKLTAFNTVEGTLASGSLTVDAPGTYWLLLCDLSPGAEYTFSSTIRMNASSAGTIYLQVTVPSANGRISFTRAGMAAVPAPATEVRMTR